MATRSRNTRVALLQTLLPAALDAVEFDSDEVTAWLKKEGKLQSIDQSRFVKWLDAIATQLQTLESTYQPFLQGRSIDELGQVERTILRIATYELTESDTPAVVAINEWVEIAKEFGALNSFRFINAVLDQLKSSLNEQT